MLTATVYMHVHLPCTFDADVLASCTCCSLSLVSAKIIIMVNHTINFHKLKNHREEDITQGI